MSTFQAAKGRRSRLRYLTVGILLAFLGIGLTLTVWSVLRAPALAERSDNPRLVERELRIRRGGIWDSDNALIAETTGPADAPQRVYPLPSIGPAVGYYSFRHGTAGVEEGYDNVLRGDNEDEWVNLANEQLHLPQDGRDIRVTLDADWQRAADLLLGDNKGAIVLLTIPDGAVRAMVSHPGYDPNELDDQFESLIANENAPLLNRAAQSQYQPGMILQPLLIAGAVDAGLISLDDVVAEAALPVVVDGQELACVSVPESAVLTWVDILRHRCPMPMAVLGELLGTAGLERIFTAFGLTRSPDLPINTETPSVAASEEPGLAAIGQENLVVTPLQMSLALAGLVNEGAMLNPQLVSAVLDESGAWVSVPHSGVAGSAVAGANANRVFEALLQQDGVISEHVAAALSGPEGRMIGWYMGVAPSAEPRYIVLVVVEDDDIDAKNAQRAGRALLNHIIGAEETIE